MGTHRVDGPEPDYRRLPESVTVEDAVATVDADPPPDPWAGRNVEQHQALQDG